MNSTLKYYEKNAEKFILDTLNKDMQTSYDTFEKHLFENAHILDAGCGSGRDSLYFKKHGYSCTAFDPSQKMCEFASRLLEQEVIQLSFEDMDFKKQFDAVWASASLLHVGKDEMLATIERLSLALKSKGVLYASFKFGDTEFIKDDRLFNSYTKESFEELIKKSSFSLLESFVVEDSRPDKKGEFWLNTLCVNDR